MSSTAGDGMTLGELGILLMRVLKRRGWIIGVIGLGSGLIAFVATLLMPVEYRAEATILPAASQSQVSGLLAQVGSLSGMLGAGAGQDLQRLYPDIIESRRLLERVLKRSYEGSTVAGWIAAREGVADSEEQFLVKSLRQRLRVRDNLRTGLVEVTYQSKDAGFSASVVNAILDELGQFLAANAQDAASAQAAMIEARLEGVAASLARSEEELRRFRERNMKVSQSPMLSLQQGRLERAVEIDGETFIALTRQLELTRLQAGPSPQAMRVLDPAVTPLEPSWPPRGRFAALGLMIGLLSAFAIATWKEHGVARRS